MARKTLNIMPKRPSYSYANQVICIHPKLKETIFQILIKLNYEQS